MANRASKVRIVVVASSLCAVLSPQHALAQRTSPSRIITLAARVTVDTAIVDTRGIVVETRPSYSYRIERSRGTDGAETAYHFEPYVLTPGTARTAPQIAPAQSYILADDLSSARLLDANGKPIPMPDYGGVPTAQAPRRPLGAIISLDAARESRLTEAQKEFGAQRGAVRGFRRFLSESPTQTSEALVDGATGLVAEFNIVKDGELDQHIEWTYAPMTAGRQHVKTVRTESRVPGGSGRRMVTMTRYESVSAAGTGE